MQSIETYGTFEQAISKADPQAQELARELREMIVAIMPEVVEVSWPKLRIASYGVGPRKNTEHFCYISAQKHDINLGFYYGAELPDPQDLLNGTGKRLRHVKLHDIGALKNPALKSLLKFATRHRMPLR
jgi:hypothetical protein